MQQIPHPTYRNDIPKNSKFITVHREMLQNEPDLWYDSTRGKYVLIFWEKDSTGKKYRRRISTHTDNKQQAKAFKAEWLEKQSEKGSKVANPYAVANALQEAFNSKRESQNLRLKTCKETERSIRFFIDYIRNETEEEHYPVQLISYKQCNSFLRSIKSFRQRNKHRANLSALWNTLVKDRETYGILENPFMLTDKVKLPDTEPEQVSEVEFRKLHEQMRTNTFQMKMYRLACAFSYFTGSRLAEVCYIRTSHTTGNNVQVRNYPDHIVKNKQNRDVPISAKVSEILQQVIALKSQHKSIHVRETEYLFCTEKGNHLIENNLSAYFKDNRKVILPNRTKVTYHSLRRSYGQNLLNDKVPIAMVSYLLGHSSIAVTEKCYANSRNIPLESIREEVNRIHSLTPPLELTVLPTPKAIKQRGKDTLLHEEFKFRTGVKHG